jgi:hypothetical protein
MRRFIGIAAAAAALSLLGCETSDTQRRQGRSSVTRPVENRPPPGEYRPNDNSPMRGDENFPAEYPGTSTGTSTGGLGSSVGGSGDTATGSSIDRDSSTSSMGLNDSNSQTSTFSSTGETGSGTTNSDKLTPPGGGATGSSRADSANRYQDPAKHTEGSAKSSTGTGTSTDSKSGLSSSEPSDSTGNVGSGSKKSTTRQGRSGTGSTTRPRVGAPPASDPLGNTNMDNPDVSGTPPIPSGDGLGSNPYDLGAAKNPKGAADAGSASDGGMKLEHNLPSNETY